jgi:putative mRNA 3-end processing factor
LGKCGNGGRKGAAAGKASVLFGYSLGKAQRLLAELRRFTEQRVFVHGSMASMMEAYREAGVEMLPCERVTEEGGRGRKAARAFAGELILAPPSAAGTPWMRRFGAAADFETGFASGWMRVRGIRRRRGYDRGFVISDHADWDDLLRTVQETGAKRVLATHGYADVLARHLREQGLDAGVLPTPYRPEDED